MSKAGFLGGSLRDRLLHLLVFIGLGNWDMVGQDIGPSGMGECWVRGPNW